jgi:hypothetical protein
MDMNKLLAIPALTLAALGLSAASASAAVRPPAPPLLSVVRSVTYSSFTECGGNLSNMPTTGKACVTEFYTSREEPMYVHISSHVVGSVEVWLNYCGGDARYWEALRLPAVIRVPEARCESYGDNELFLYEDTSSFPARDHSISALIDLPITVQVTNSPELPVVR